VYDDDIRLMFRWLMSAIFSSVIICSE